MGHKKAGSAKPEPAESTTSLPRDKTEAVINGFLGTDGAVHWSADCVDGFMQCRVSRLDHG